MIIYKGGCFMKKSFIVIFLFFYLTISCFAKDADIKSIKQNLRTGMPQAEVAEVAGTPDVVQKSPEGYQVWIYNKTSSHTIEKYDKSWNFFLLFGKRKGCKSIDTTETTESLVINFDKDDCIESFMYRAKSFGPPS